MLICTIKELSKGFLIIFNGLQFYTRILWLIFINKKVFINLLSKRCIFWYNNAIRYQIIHRPKQQ